MKESLDYSDRRQHERTSAQYIALGIINSGELETIGSIIDISLGGVKCTYDELRMVPYDTPIYSINLIVDNHYLFNIPCEYAWNVKLETESHSKLTNLRQCGIEFGRLTSNQILLLKSFINRCTFHWVQDITSDIYI